MDIDGTVTGPGQRISPVAVKAITKDPSIVVLNTAQSAAYVDEKIGLKDFPNLISEKGITQRIGGIETAQFSPTEVSGFISAMERLLGDLRSEFVFNKKVAGYAVGYENVNFESEDLAKVKYLMEEQASSTDGKFIFEPTAGFYDLTLASLSKATALEEIHGKGHFPLRTKWIAMGDSPNTDGPMLDKAVELGGMGFMVGKAYKSYTVLPTFLDVIYVVNWFLEVQAAPDRI